jgi:DNA-binding winged helix-turn-helix (wHTH) protein
MEQRTLKGYLFGPFRLDLETGYLYHDNGQEVELTATHRKILEYMLENTNEKGGTLFTRERIIPAVWGNVAIESGTFDKHIGALRKVFARGEGDQSVIETKHGEGYRFKLPVTRIHAAANDLASSYENVRAEVESPRPSEGYELFRQEADADSFGLWLIGRGGRPISLVILLLVSITVATSISYRMYPTLAQTIASIGQCVIIFLLFLHSLRNPPNALSLNKSEAEVIDAGYNSLEEYRAEEPFLQKRLRLFTRWWSLMLVSWVPLYIVYAWETWGTWRIDDAADVISQRASILEAVFNIVNTAMVILCYNVLNQEPGRQRRTGVFTGPAAIGIALLALIPLLSGSRPLTAQQGLAAFTLLTGLYAGIYMALFVARLQSKFLDPAPLLVVLLFSYTAIQPLARYIQSYKEWAWAVLDYALVLKCLLYLYVLWLLQCGDLLFYFREVKRAYDDRLDQRRRAHRRLIG